MFLFRPPVYERLIFSFCAGCILFLTQRETLLLQTRNKRTISRLLTVFILRIRLFLQIERFSFPRFGLTFPISNKEFVLRCPTLGLSDSCAASSTFVLKVLKYFVECRILFSLLRKLVYSFTGRAKICRIIFLYYSVPPVLLTYYVSSKKYLKFCFYNCKKILLYPFRMMSL